MAKVKLGVIATEITGKLGGHVFQNNPSGTILATKSNPGKISSYNGNRQSTILQQVIQLWKGVGDSDKQLWTDFAMNYETFPINASIVNLSKRQGMSGSNSQKGYCLFVQYNTIRLQLGLSYLPYPSPGSNPIAPISATLSYPSTEVQITLSRALDVYGEELYISLSSPFPSWKNAPGKTFTRVGYASLSSTLKKIGFDECYKCPWFFNQPGVAWINVVVISLYSPFYYRLIDQVKFDIPI